MIFVSTQNQIFEGTQCFFIFLDIVREEMDSVDKSSKICQILVEMFQKLTNHGWDEISQGW